MITCTKAWRKPMIPINRRDFNQLFGMCIPRLFNGPIEKLKMRRIKALNALPLFKMKNGRSFQGTGPSMLYLRMAYPREMKKKNMITRNYIIILLI